MDNLYFMEYMMENVAIFSPILSVLNILTLVFLILYMNYTAKYKNHDLSVAWYILGIFFPLPVAIAFAIKSKKFRHENTKVCSQCGDKYPETFTMCSRCLIDLPELNDKGRMKKKKLGKIFGILFWIVTVISVVAVSALLVTVVNQTLDMLDDTAVNYRIGITDETGETVYYDREGNAYSDPTAVLIYGKNGEVYTYTTVDDTSVSEEDAFYFETQVYVDQDGNEYDIYNCYVDAEGYFFYDENYEIIWDDSGYDYDSDEYEDFDDYELWYEDENYRYYQDRYYDDDGNIYYYADEVSWNEKGEIITADNDPNPPVPTEIE